MVYRQHVDFSTSVTVPSPDDSPDRLLPLKNEVLWLLLSLKHGERHGYALMQDVEARSEERVRIPTGALYRTLHRMEADCLVGEAEAPPDETDTRRRYYRITPFGVRVLSAELARMRRLVDSGVRAGVLPAGGGG
jgi:DNA-binding PadR family transcriptional regulator